MTGSSAQPRGKRLHSCVLNTLRWVDTLGNLRENRRNGHKTSTTADGGTAALENDGKIRQPSLNAELLGKYRLNMLSISPMRGLRPH